METPAARPARPAATTSVRWCGLILMLGCAGLLAVAAWLKPDPRGYGTHEQFGGGPCGWLVVTHYPCPTCGMTTAFAHTVRGQWVRAFLVQPAGLILALATAAAAVLGASAVVTGRWPMRLALILTPYRLFFGLLVLLLGGWGFKLVLGLLMGTLPIDGVH